MNLRGTGGFSWWHRLLVFPLSCHLPSSQTQRGRRHPMAWVCGLSKSQLRQRRHHPSSTDVRNDAQFKHPNRREIDMMIGYLVRCALRGLKFHCCRTISWKDKTYSCVRSATGSSQFIQIRRRCWGWLKSSRIVCFPGPAACHPEVRSGSNACSIGWMGLLMWSPPPEGLLHSSIPGQRRGIFVKLDDCLRIGLPLDLSWKISGHSA